MNQFPSNRVRPIVRILAGVFGVAFALAGLLAVAMTAYTAWGGIPTRHIAWKIVAACIFLSVGAFIVARMFLEVAVTGENPRIDEDDETEIIPPPI